MGKTTQLAERLAEILIRLNNGEKVTPKKLALDFGVTERIIQKDLNERFYHLRLERTKNAEYSLPQGRLGKFKVEDISLFAKLAGLDGLYPELNQALVNKLLFNEGSEKAYTIIGHHYEEINDRCVDFQHLEKYILEHTMIKFQYRDKEYNKIKPYRLVNQSGIWYLVLLNEKEELRSFHFKKIKFIKREGASFKPDPKIQKKIEESESISFETNLQTITIKVDPQVAHYFERRQILPRQKNVFKDDDGFLTVETEIGNLDLLIPKLLYWLSHIEIILPEVVKSEIMDDIKCFMTKNFIENPTIPRAT